MRRLRFSLSALLVLITALAAFFGYAQWRRLAITREYVALTKEGISFSAFEDSWWPAAPRIAIVFFVQDGSGKLRHNQNALTAAEAKRRFLGWEARLMKLGVPDIRLAVLEMDGTESLIGPEELDDYAR